MIEEISEMLNIIEENKHSLKDNDYKTVLELLSKMNKKKDYKFCKVIVIDTDTTRLCRGIGLS